MLLILRRILRFFSTLLLPVRSLFLSLYLVFAAKETTSLSFLTIYQRIEFCLGFTIKLLFCFYYTIQAVGNGEMDEVVEGGAHYDQGWM